MNSISKMSIDLTYAKVTEDFLLVLAQEICYLKTLKSFQIILRGCLNIKSAMVDRFKQSIRKLESLKDIIASCS